MDQFRKNLILITGGVRSGKSSFAKDLAEKFGKKVVFIATAQPLDAEMQDRITLHKKNRPSHWRTFEEPYHLDQAIKKAGKESEVILIDCLGLFISNLMKEFKEDADNEELTKSVLQKIEGIIKESRNTKATVIIVSNEVGLALVPANPMGRFFRDILGQANQIIASTADEVYLLISGIPLLIKGNNNEKDF